MKYEITYPKQSMHLQSYVIVYYTSPIDYSLPLYLRYYLYCMFRKGVMLGTLVVYGVYVVSAS